MEAEPAVSESPAPRATTAVLGTAGANLLLTVISLVTGVLAARLLGPEGRGHLAAAQAIGTLVGAAGSLALGEALVYFVGRRVRPPLVVLRTATLVAAGSTVVWIAIAWFIMPVVLAGQPEAVGAARAYAFVGLPFVLVGFPVTLLRATQRYGTWNTLRLFAPLSWLLALVLFTMTQKAAVTPLIIVFIMFQMLLTPVVWVIAGRGQRETPRVDLTLMKPMMRYGTPLFLAMLPTALNLRFDQVLIANMESADQLGLYAVSVSWAGLGLPLMTAIGSVLFPRLAAMDIGDAWKTFARSSRAGVMIAIVIGIVSACTGPFLIPSLFGRAFSVPLTVPLVLAAATSVLGLNGILEEGLRGLGEPRIVMIGELAGLALTVLLLLVLVPVAGIGGAAVASLVGYTVVTAALVWRVRVQSQIRVSDLLVPRRDDVSGLVGRAWAARRQGPSE